MLHIHRVGYVGAVQRLQERSVFVSLRPLSQPRGADHRELILTSGLRIDPEQHLGMFPVPLFLDRADR